MSTVILLGLAVMWAVVLVPMWLRRHDEVEESRSLDRFSTAMHTLARRDEPPAKKYVVMPHRSRAPEVHVSGAAAEGGGKRRPSPAQRRARAARRVLTPAARRRRTLIGLLLATVVTVVAAVVIGGLALWGVQILVDGCLLGFVAHLRNRARRARPANRRPAAGRTAGAARPAHQARPAVARPARRPQPISAFDQVTEPEVAAAAAAEGRQVRYRFDDVGFAADAVDDEPAAAVVTHAEAAETVVERVASYERRPEPAAAVDADGEIGERPWEPVPVPRPVYTTKPPAPPRKHRAPIFEPMLPPVDSPAELDPVDDLEEILDRRWAVND